MTPVLLGLLAGCIASVASGRLLRGFLYGVTSSDPVVIAGVAIGLAAVAAAACYLPARRVTQADPLAALRSE
jgi:ABC-type antimicrobial peptide transport system permease subunit